jgi:dihydropteridine reductase
MRLCLLKETQTLLRLSAQRRYTPSVARWNHTILAGLSSTTSANIGSASAGVNAERARPGAQRRLYYDDALDEEPRRTVLVLGSSGALGSSVAHHLSQDLGMRVLGADVMELPSDLMPGWELDGFIGLERSADLSQLTVDLVRGVDYCLRDIRHESEKDTSTGLRGLDAIICANGGWQGDPPPVVRVLDSVGNDVEDNEWREQMEEGALEYAKTISNMMQSNLDPLLAAGYVAQHFLNPGSLMVVMGATAALSPTPGMLGYGLAKTASHHFVQTLGASTGQSLETKSIRKAGRRVRQHLPALDNLTVVGILPTMIDTEANRKADPKGKFEEWTKPAHIAREIGSWVQKPPLRPHSGSLVKVYAKDGIATFEVAR